MVSKKRTPTEQLEGGGGENAISCQFVAPLWLYVFSLFYFWFLVNLYTFTYIVLKIYTFIYKKNIRSLSLPPSLG